MATPTKYTYSIATDVGGPVDSDFLTTDIPAAGIATELLRIDTDGDVLDIWFADALSGGDQTILTVCVTQYMLEAAKQRRYVEIDARTDELIAQGFTFGGKVFSLASDAQVNIIGLDMAREDPAMTYPVNYGAKDSGDYLAIPDAATMHGLYLTALGTKRYHLDTGRVLKTTVFETTTVAAALAVVDAR
jgi:hypothetical protein